MFVEKQLYEKTYIVNYCCCFGGPHASSSATRFQGDYYGGAFLMITPDARSAGMGELGVATSPDAYSQQWNPAKYGFIQKQIGIGISYTPYLSELVNDIFLGNLTFYNRLSERSAWAASIKYFSLGDVEFTELVGNDGCFTRY